MIGQTLGHYRIIERIGAGGMGEVYRAEDTKLGRAVALKLLPAKFASDAERMARFEREAQLLAALNHPNIAAIYGVEETSGTRALVMELVEGPTLAEHVSGAQPGAAALQGGIPLEEALPIAKQMAEALEYAHERGIIHRDLKPSNAKVTPNGTVKVLDFGLAKALETESEAGDLSASPTMTAAATQAGIILGTLAYMSPEQAKGRAADKRSDIWAYGCVLYEMLTGRRAFEGESVSETLASVLKIEPEWSALPAGIPPALVKLLRRCLEKDPRQRLQAIGEARIAVNEILSGKSEGITAEEKTTAMMPAVRRWLPWGVASTLGVALVIVLWSGWRLSPSKPVPVKHALINLGEGQRFLMQASESSLAVSPDSRYLAYIAVGGSLATSGEIYLRPTDQLQASSIAVTEVGGSPFFSPDSEWIGYFSGGELKKISIHGGAPQTLCDAPDARGASWGSDGSIVFSASVSSGLWRIGSGGGSPQKLTEPDRQKGEQSHRWPEVLPGGQAVLFTIEKTGLNFDDAQIAVLSLKTGQWRILLGGGTNPHYSPTGHIVYARAGGLMAVPFDAARLEVTGPPVPVLDGVGMSTVSGWALFSFSSEGMLLYAPGSALMASGKLVWVDRKGAAKLLGAQPRAYAQPTLSPEGRRVTVASQEANLDVWVYDTGRGGLARLTFQPGEDESPVWTPDGKKVAYSSSLSGKARTILWKNSDGSGTEDPLVASGYHTHLSSFSSDGRFLAYTDYDPITRGDIWVLPLEENATSHSGGGVTGRQPRVFLQTPFNERDAKFSPDGHWIAYSSDESGSDQIYVQAFPGPGGKWQVSADGGYGPTWAANGRELFYRNGDTMMVVSVTTRPSFSAMPPRVLFEGKFEENNRRESNYDVAPDGQHFLMIKASEAETGPTQLHLVVNWFEELKQRAANSTK